MKKLIRICLAIAVTVVCCACPTPTPDTDPVLSRSYITAYGWFDGIELEATQQAELKLVPRYDARDWRTVGWYVYSYSSTGVALEKYDALCEKHNDMNYNRLVEWENACCAYDFISLSVVCTTKEWDADHPVGKPLDDRVRFRGRSILPYIAGGYDGAPRWQSVDSGQMHRRPSSRGFMHARTLPAGNDPFR